MFLCSCVQSVRGMLENPTEAVTDLSYFDCIDSVMENSKVQISVIESLFTFSVVLTPRFLSSGPR